MREILKKEFLQKKVCYTTKLIKYNVVYVFSDSMKICWNNNFIIEHFFFLEKRFFYFSLLLCRFLCCGRWKCRNWRFLHIAWMSLNFLWEFLKLFKALYLEVTREFCYLKINFQSNYSCSQIYLKNGKLKYQKLLLFSNHLVSGWKIQILSKQFKHFNFHWNFSLNCKWYWFQLIFTKLFQFRFWGWNQNFNQIFVG